MSPQFTVLVPHRPGRLTLAQKEAQIRREHRIPRDLMIVFLEVDLSDASEFVNDPHLQIRQEEGRYVMKITEVRDIPFAEMKPTLVAGAKNRGAYATP